MTQSFDEWYFDAKQHNTDGFTNREFYEAGQQSRQAEIDELQKRIDVYEKHIAVIKHIHKNEFNEDSGTSWILGNLDGFFECLNEDLKGNQDEMV